jgi:hypothetical protein
MDGNDKFDRRLIIRVRIFFDIGGEVVDCSLSVTEMIVESGGDEDCSSLSEILEFNCRLMEKDQQ